MALVGIVHFLGRTMPKGVFGHMWTANCLISMRIRVVWSGPLLSANRIIWYYKMFQWRENVWTRFCVWAEWCAFSHFEHDLRYTFAWRDPILNCLSDKYPRIAIFARQGAQVWNDQQVVVDDSFERCSGYQYFGIIDHDEFFIPSKNRTLLETLVSENIRGINIQYKRCNVKRKTYFWAYAPNEDSD